MKPKSKIDWRVLGHDNKSYKSGHVHIGTRLIGFDLNTQDFCPTIIQDIHEDTYFIRKLNTTHGPAFICDQDSLHGKYQTRLDLTHGTTILAMPKLLNPKGGKDVVLLRSKLIGQFRFKRLTCYPVNNYFVGESQILLHGVE